jgi:PAS domain S-box-containing protein
MRKSVKRSLAKVKNKGLNKQNKPKSSRHSKRFKVFVKEKTADVRIEDEKLRNIFTASPDAITVTDLNGIVIDCNQAALEVYHGTSKQDLVGKNAIELIAEKDRQTSMENMVKTLKNGSIKNLEYTLLTKDGVEYPAELSASVVKDASGNPIAFAAIVKDITERKRVEEALKNSEERYRSVVDNIGIGVSIISQKMEILALNKQMKKWFPKIHVSKRPICYRAFNNPPRKNVCSYCPTFKTLKDGKIHESITATPQRNKIINFRVVSSPIKDRNGKVIAAIEMVDDITERRRMEKKLERYSAHLKKLVEERTCKLQESEIRFGSVANYASEAIITIDDRGTVVFWNKAAETIFGYSANEVIGKSIGLIIPEGARKGELKSMSQGIAKRRLRFVGKTLQLTGLRKDESEFPMELSFSVWKTREGTFSTGIVRDTTERKKMENERKHYEEMLSALNSCGGKLNAAKSLDEVYKLTLDTMEQTLGFKQAAFMIAENGKLKPVSQRGYSSSFGFELPLDGSKKGVTVKAVVNREVCLVPDVTRDKDYVKGDLRAPDLLSELAVPIMVEDQVLGVLNVESIALNAFDRRDALLLQILASHAATAISNLKKRDEIEKRSNQQTSLMKSSAEMIHSIDLHYRLQAIMDAIQGLGWRRVVLSVRDENLEILKTEDIVTAGLTKEEKGFLWTNKQPGQVWRERFGIEYARFKLGEFYYLPWDDPFVRKRFSEGTVSSHLTPEEMVDWNPDDLLYAPLRLADGRIVGVVSMDDPVDGRRPTRESLASLELFLHQAAVAIENAQLIENLKDARKQLEAYADQLEIKVKERTRELVEAQNKLLKAERLVAIGELAGMVGHDLRNPLTGIAGATYYLKAKYGPTIDNKGKEMLSVIEKDIEYSNKIINDLLEYSRDIQLKLTETSSKAMLNEALVRVKVPATIKVSDETKTKPKIKADVEKMRRVFINIIKNAFDAMPNGGELRIKSKRLKDNVAIAFSDTGTGMTKETMNKLWTPLFTTKARGMGFGLPICKRVVESHKGKICVESTVGKGTTFTVTLPLEPKTEKRDEQIWINVPETILLKTRNNISLP